MQGSQSIFYFICLLYSSNELTFLSGSSLPVCGVKLCLATAVPSLSLGGAGRIGGGDILISLIT